MRVSLPHLWEWRARPLLLAAAVLLALGPFTWWLSGLWESHQITLQVDQARARSDTRAEEFNRNFQRALTYLHGVPTLIAAETVVQSADLTRTLVPSNEVNRFLAFFTRALGVDLAFIVNEDGLCVASSNSDESISLVGERFGDRHYFTTAMRGEPAIQYAVGRRTNIPGIFFSVPLHRGGTVSGVVVVKIDIPTIERFVSTADSFLTDRNGVVILAQSPDWVLKALPGAPVFELPSEAVDAEYKRRKIEAVPYTEADNEPIPFHIGAAQSPAVVSTIRRDDGLAVHAYTMLDRVGELGGERASLFAIAYGGSLALTWGTAVSMLLLRRARLHRRNLLAAKDLAEAANRAKSQFLATMSHEIRTPMNGILGMAQLLMTSELEPSERQHYVQVILSSGETLLTLLNDILDLSKIEANKLELESIAFTPADILNETQTLFAKAVADKGLRLDTRHVTAESHRFMGDPSRLRQMLCNLISNAIKFTDQGDIVVEFHEIDAEKTHSVLEFAVSDTGVGIPTDKHALMFAPFFQADSSTTRRYGGTGLGLSIVRYLAERMGGTAGFDSMPGRGSRFWFRVRAEHVVVEDSAPANADSLIPEALKNGQRRLLVVEDNATNRTVIAAMLGRLGVSFETATNGQEALDRIMAGDEVDLVLMDCQMPVMDGLEATRRIRRWEEDRHAKRRLPIIALTAGAFEEDRDRCLAAGMNDFLTKPLALRNLTAIFEKWIGGG